MLQYTQTFTLALREQSSRTLLGFRSKWSKAGDREWRKFIPRATWWASLKTKAQGGVAPKVFWFKVEEKRQEKIRQVSTKQK